MSRFVLVNVGLMPLSLKWDLAKGTGFFDIKRVFPPVIHCRANVLQLVCFFRFLEIVDIPDEFDFPA